MIELSRDEFCRAAPLFDIYHQLRPAIYSFLAGMQPARLYVDDAQRPRTAILRSDFVYLAGDCSNAAVNQEFVALLRREIMPEREWMLIWSAPDAWRPVLDVLLSPPAPGHYVRSSFDLNQAAFRACEQSLPPLAEGYALVPMDARTAPEAGGLDQLWGSIEQFLAHGFGYCVLQGDTFVASAQSVFVGDGRVEVGVGVREPFRRRGFGTAVAAAVIARCLCEGLTPEWGCMYNAASASLARSLGFVPGPDVPFHLVKGPTASPTI